MQPLLKPDEVSELLGISPGDVRRIMPRHVRVGPRSVRYPLEAVAEVWPLYWPGEDFQGEYERTLRARKPKPSTDGTRQKGRYRIPAFPITGRVYFISGGDLIKIGYAKQPLKRLTSLKSGSPYELTLIASMAGSMALERHLHDRFADLRQNGEWFRADPKLLRFIREAAGWKHARET